MNVTPGATVSAYADPAGHGSGAQATAPGADVFGAGSAVVADAEI